jgi:hypothetical protein
VDDDEVDVELVEVELVDVVVTEVVVVGPSGLVLSHATPSPIAEPHRRTLTHTVPETRITGSLDEDGGTLPCSSPGAQGSWTGSCPLLDNQQIDRR